MDFGMAVRNIPEVPAGGIDLIAGIGRVSRPVSEGTHSPELQICQCEWETLPRRGVYSGGNLSLEDMA